MKFKVYLMDDKETTVEAEAVRINRELNAYEFLCNTALFLPVVVATFQVNKIIGFEVDDGRKNNAD